ncbi:MAG: alpha/beta hydrolase [bacterium]|jgi:pimeloyl-ACP methyl ester carboxylesterase
MPYFNSNNVRIFYEERGMGTPILFLHGFSLDHRMWSEQLAFFSSWYRAIALDARGHGQSDAPESDYAREDRVADVLNLMADLKLPQVHLVGLSMGGGDALAMAVDHQDKLLSLTLADTVASGYKPKVRPREPKEHIAEKDLEKFKEMFIESSLSRYGKEMQDIKNKLAIMMRAFSGKPWTDPKKGKYPKRDDLKMAASVRIPTLIIAGKRDIAWLPLSQKLSEIILDSRLVVLSGAGHMSNMEAPDRFNETLAAFIKEVDVKARRPRN